MSVFNKISALIDNKADFCHIHINKQNIDSLTIAKEEIEKEIKQMKIDKKKDKNRKNVDINDNVKFSSLQNAIVASSLIGSLLSRYEENVQLNGKRQIVGIPAIKKIRARVKKLLFVASRTNKVDFFKAIETRDKILSETTAHFANQEVKIESLSIVLNLFYHFEKELKQHANLSEKLMLKLEDNISENTYIENSNLFSDHIVKLLSSYTGKSLKENTQLANCINKMKEEKKCKEI